MAVFASQRKKNGNLNLKIVTNAKFGTYCELSMAHLIFPFEKPLLETKMASYEQDAADAEDLVARATDEQLQGPEWQLNMAICDMANANHAM